jgi:hypothetical protein
MISNLFDISEYFIIIIDRILILKTYHLIMMNKICEYLIFLIFLSQTIETYSMYIFDV